MSLHTLFQTRSHCGLSWFHPQPTGAGWRKQTPSSRHALRTPLAPWIALTRIHICDIMRHIYSGIIESKATQRVAVRQATVARLALETDTTTLIPHLLHPPMLQGIYLRSVMCIRAEERGCRYDGSAIVSMRVFGRSVVQPSFHAEKMCTRRRVEYLIPLRILVRPAQPSMLCCNTAALCCNAVVLRCTMLNTGCLIRSESWRLAERRIHAGLPAHGSDARKHTNKRSARAAAHLSAGCSRGSSVRCGRWARRPQLRCRMTSTTWRWRVYARWNNVPAPAPAYSAEAFLCPALSQHCRATPGARSRSIRQHEASEAYGSCCDR